jgi:hypothetical protein
MKTAIILKRLALLMIVLSVAYGCVGIPSTGRTLRATDFKGEISRIESNKKSSILSGEASRHYRLAILYSHQNNPRPDFKAAAKHFKDYLKLRPTGARSDDVRYKLGLIERLVRASDDSKKNKDAMKKLEDLDMTIEKRRKGAR